MDSSGELLFTILSSLAQEESRNISENTAWGIRSKFKKGIPHLNVKRLLGYEKDEEGNLFAVDIKSSYRKNASAINGMTLGAFTGYFRERLSTKNTTHPYGQYKAHVVLGIIYSLNEGGDDEFKVYQLSDIDAIQSVIRDFTFFVQEKWRIAIDRAGSGNTKNIGSVSNIRQLIEGTGPFAELGEHVFDDYWMNYLTQDMARKAELPRPYYKNLAEYKQFRRLV